MHADAEGNASAETLRQLLAERLGSLHHVHGGAAGEIDGVLLRDRGIPEGHCTVADEFVKGAVMAHDAFGRQCQIAVDDLNHSGRIKRFAHGGKAADIHEQHGDVIGLSAELQRAAALTQQLGHDGGIDIAPEGV